MPSKDKIELEGTVTKVLKGTNFEVELDDNHQIIKCTMSGKLRINKIRILAGDKVIVAISPYDLTRGIIIWRSK